jgi:purine-binding chemotaxis protein CheW
VENQQLMLLFRAHRHLCAIPVERVIETMRPLPIEPLAIASGAVLGLCRIRGTSVPVVDTGALFGAQGEAASARFIVLRIENRIVALAVESVTGIRAVPSRALQDLPPLLGEANAALVASIGAADGAFLLVLRTARILAEAHEAMAEAAYG